MRTIYRYEVAETDRQLIPMPRGARLLSIQRQTRFPLGMSLWALVDPEAEIVNRTIFWRGTGHEAPGDETYKTYYIGTYQEADGIVGHFFDGGES